MDTLRASQLTSELKYILNNYVLRKLNLIHLETEMCLKFNTHYEKYFSLTPLWLTFPQIIICFMCYYFSDLKHRTSSQISLQVSLNLHPSSESSRSDLIEPKCFVDLWPPFDLLNSSIGLRADGKTDFSEQRVR